MIQSSSIKGATSPNSGDRKRKQPEPKDWFRLEDQFYRINVNLVNIIANLDAIPRILEDLEEDPLKASKKQIEFSTRFTRNYLCELRKKMNDIKKFLEQSENETPPKNQPILQCFTSSFNTAQQAFQNIEKNLRYVIFNKMPVQISEFLNCFGDLCLISNAAYWEGNGDKLLELETLNSSLITKLNEIEDNARKAEIQKKEKQKTILKFKTDVKKPLSLQTKGKGLNLSMYKSSQASNFEKLWKKKTKDLAEARFGKKNRQEFQNNDNEESLKSERSKEAGNDKNRINKPMIELKEEILARQKRKKPVPENEMETMVQSVSIHSATSESESEVENIEIDMPENIVEIENEITIDKEVTPEVDADKFTMGPVMDEAFKTMFNHIMSQVMTNINPDKQDFPMDETIRDSVAREVRRSNFREDNVKLICIVEDETATSTQLCN